MFTRRRDCRGAERVRYRKTGRGGVISSGNRTVIFEEGRESLRSSAIRHAAGLMSGKERIR